MRLGFFGIVSEAGCGIGLSGLDAAAGRK